MTMATRRVPILFYSEHITEVKYANNNSYLSPCDHTLYLTNGLKWAKALDTLIRVHIGISKKNTDCFKGHCILLGYINLAKMSLHLHPVSVAEDHHCFSGQ